MRGRLGRKFDRLLGWQPVGGRPSRKLDCMFGWKPVPLLLCPVVRTRPWLRRRLLLPAKRSTRTAKLKFRFGCYISVWLNHFAVLVPQCPRPPKITSSYLTAALQGRAMSSPLKYFLNFACVLRSTWLPCLYTPASKALCKSRRTIFWLGAGDNLYR